MVLVDVLFVSPDTWRIDNPFFRYFSTCGYLLSNSSSVWNEPTFLPIGLVLRYCSKPERNRWTILFLSSWFNVFMISNMNWVIGLIWPLSSKVSMLKFLMNIDTFIALHWFNICKTSREFLPIRLSSQIKILYQPLITWTHLLKELCNNCLFLGLNFV